MPVPLSHATRRVRRRATARVDTNPHLANGSSPAADAPSDKSEGFLACIKLQKTEDGWKIPDHSLLPKGREKTHIVRPAGAPVPEVPGYTCRQTRPVRITYLEVQGGEFQLADGTVCLDSVKTREAVERGEYPDYGWFDDYPAQLSRRNVPVDGNASVRPRRGNGSQ